MHPLVEAHLDEIRSICRGFGVSKLELFGSAATDAFDPDRSDVDFIAHYPDGYDYGPWLGRFQDLERALAAELGRDVDLVMTSALKNRWFAREAAKTRMVIYDASEVSEVA
jgi:predicted nucleotidyltransferase